MIDMSSRQIVAKAIGHQSPLRVANGRRMRWRGVDLWMLCQG